MSNRTAEQKVLARASNPDRALLIATLLQTGLWDVLPPTDRSAWCERGEILDSPGGRLLFQLVNRAGGLS